MRQLNGVLRDFVKQVLLGLDRPVASGELLKLAVGRMVVANVPGEPVGEKENSGRQGRLLQLARLLVLDDVEVRRRVVCVDVGSFFVFVPFVWMEVQLKEKRVV